MQHHGRKHFSRRPPTANSWLWGQNSTFSECGNVAFQREWNIQQHGRKYFSRRPPTANYWDWGQNSTFSEYGNVAFQREWRMQQHGNILPADPGGKGQNSTFSEYGHVAYHIKGNDACSNMVANILPADPPNPGGGVKILFQNMLMLHIKLNGITYIAATCKHILSLHAPLAPGVGSNVKTIFF